MLLAMRSTNMLYFGCPCFPRIDLIWYVWISFFLSLPWISTAVVAVQPTGGSALVLYWTGIMGASSAVWLVAIEATYHYLVDIGAITPKHTRCGTQSRTITRIKRE
jgi:archaellum biogenesis protein FlaJ (TadC family)